MAEIGKGQNHFQIKKSQDETGLIKLRVSRDLTLRGQLYVCIIE